MTITIDSTGLHVQTLGDIHDEIVADLASRFSLTPEQAQRVRTNVQSKLGRLARIDAEREAALHDAFASLYNTLTLSAEGAALDRVVALLGVARRGAQAAEVIGTIVGNAGQTIPAGTRIQHESGPVFATLEDVVLAVDVAGNGTAPATLRAEATGPAPVELAEPETSEWTLLDVLPAFTSFVTEDQPNEGSRIETDAELRARASIEAYSRASGPVSAIESSLIQVRGVTEVAVWESRAARADEVDSDGIPARCVNAVVTGGTDADVAAALLRARAAGAWLFALPGPTFHAVTLAHPSGQPVEVQFNRFAVVPVYVRATLYAADSAVPIPSDAQERAAAAIFEAASKLGVGRDVLPWRLEAAIHASGIIGIENATVELSRDGETWMPVGAKLPISIRETSELTADRITIVEV